ncbi:amidohydrolase family protein [Corallococcus sp. AS-1-6]|uniref:amidohydrolase family protein n=1 Tax=Corallococcus sp. AS-1-6 TaxID=2874599 RepID=UPI001CC01C36|nr:amidohydrolase family protein [Corallococcus sp. AS-1-6]MBZ4373206.1 amidohydrolase family protein [Corallococcus sp. AS-1-6]
MSFRSRLTALALVCLASSPALAERIPVPPPIEVASRVVFNGSYRADPDGPAALTSWAFNAQGEVIAMGSEFKVRRHVGTTTAVMDVQGRPVLDAASDIHVHGDAVLLPQMLVTPVPGVLVPYTDWSQLLSDVQARAAQVRAAEQAAVDAGQPMPTRLPIVGVMLFPLYSQLRGFNIADALEATAPGFVVHFFDADGHGSLFNWTAAAAAGFNPYSPDPEGGRFARDAGLRLKGKAFEYAQVPFYRYVASFIPHAAKVGQLNALVRGAAANGYCRLTDINFVDAPAQAEQVRLDTDEPQFIQGACLATTMAEVSQCSADDNGITTLKVFADGAYVDGGADTDEYGDSNLALAYANPQLVLDDAETPYWGHLNLTDAQLDQRLAWVLADKEHRRLIVHATGRGAIGQLARRMKVVGGSLAAFVDVMSIEHAELISDELMAELGEARLRVALNTPHYELFPAIAALYPQHIAEEAQLLRSFYAAGFEVGFGGDRFQTTAPVFAQAAQAANHRLPGESISFATFWRSQARTSPAIRGMRGVGTLKVGARANLIVTSQDPYTVTAATLGNTTSRLTICDGRVFFSDGTLAPATPL